MTKKNPTQAGGAHAGWEAQVSRRKECMTRSGAVQELFHCRIGTGILSAGWGNRKSWNSRNKLVDLWGKMAIEVQLSWRKSLCELRGSVIIAGMPGFWWCEGGFKVCGLEVIIEKLGLTKLGRIWSFAKPVPESFARFGQQVQNFFYNCSS